MDNGEDTETLANCVTDDHPHELEPRYPAKKCCSRGAFGSPICAGCEQKIPSTAVYYACAGKPKPCNYNLCKGCLNLGPGEGGLVQTASKGHFSGDPKDEVVPRISYQSSHSSGILTKSSSKDFPITSEGEKIKPQKNQKKVSSARTGAANLNFGLSTDSAAAAQWSAFAKEGKSDVLDGERELHDIARQVASHLRFFTLTVMPHDKLRKEQASRSKLQNLELYSPYAGVPTNLKTQLIQAACKVPQAARSMGSIVGMAVGDAVGAPFEFLDAVDIEGSTGSMFDLAKFIPYNTYNRFKTSSGQWTDDSSMGLCLADSLLAKDCYDGSDVRIRYHNWWFRGYNNAFGNDQRIGSVGLGGNVAESLRAMNAGKTPTPEFKAKTHDAGNGAIMRLAPVPIFHACDVVQAAKISAKSATATHPGPIAAAAAAFQGFIIASAIQRGPEEISAKEFLDGVVQEFQQRGCPGAENCSEVHRLLKSSEPKGGKEECWNWRAPKLEIEASLEARGMTYNGYRCTADYFGSYSVDGLAIALWCFYNTSSFAAAIVRCVNYLGDADTTAAICGQMAGAFYGYEAIDSRWIVQVSKWDDYDIACRGALLFVRRKR